MEAGCRHIERQRETVPACWYSTHEIGTATEGGQSNGVLRAPDCGLRKCPGYQRRDVCVDVQLRMTPGADVEPIGHIGRRGMDDSVLAGPLVSARSENICVTVRRAAVLASSCRGRIGV